MFGLLKLWIELRIHKGGLEWGQLDLNLSKLHNPISITDNTTHFSQNNTNYTAPQKFFFGIVTEKFRKNWTQSIIPLVNETNFDYTIIMNSSNIFALNIDSRNMTQFSDAVKQTYLMIEKCLEEIFHNSNIVSEYDK